MEEKTEAVKGEETTVGLTMNYNPFSFISCQEDALVLAGCISHGLDADVIKKSGDLFATARAMLLDACVCLLYRQGGDSMSMQGLVDLLQNDISHAYQEIFTRFSDGPGVLLDEIEIPEGYRIISGEKWASDLSGIGREWIDDIKPCWRPLKIISDAERAITGRQAT